MLFSEENYKFMYAALLEAEKALEENEVPVGAVIVKDNKIIGRGHNQIERLKDPTAHAEMIAITAASENLNNKFLTGCDIYVTVEPCLMCAGALILSRIDRIFFSIFEPKSGACGSIYDVVEENRLNHKIKVFNGLYETEARNLMESFFKEKRQTENKNTKGKVCN